MRFPPAQASQESKLLDQPIGYYSATAAMEALNTATHEGAAGKGVAFLAPEPLLPEHLGHFIDDLRATRKCSRRIRPGRIRRRRSGRP